MIRHIVLFSLKEGVAADDPRVAEAVEASRALDRSVPHVGSWMIEPNITVRDIAADFAAIGDFADADALQAFIQHPDHVAAGRRWAELATWAIADFHVPAT